jgi:hypothetical protein
MSKFTGLQTIKESTPRGAESEQKPELQQKQRKRLGKRQDPNYQQISVYMKTDTYIEAKRKLLGTGPDFSDLVNRLVQEWNNR